VVQRILRHSSKSTRQKKLPLTFDAPTVRLELQNPSVACNSGTTLSLDRVIDLRIHENPDVCLTDDQNSNPMKKTKTPREQIRCPWAQGEQYVDYHDVEWGVPVHDDRLLFEFLILEGAQAGLSWSTILKKRENYRQAFDHFDPGVVAKYDADRQAELMSNAGIVRNRLKIESSIDNAKAFLAVQNEFGSFDRYIWRFPGGQPIQNSRKSIKDVPASTPESDAMSKDLKKRGFRFVGTTICYAFMQAVGMVNDHLVDCFRHSELQPETARR
jgi:DNA-3-methyladenine glycosylase I